MANKVVIAVAKRPSKLAAAIYLSYSKGDIKNYFQSLWGNLQRELRVDGPIEHVLFHYATYIKQNENPRDTKRIKVYKSILHPGWGAALHTVEAYDTYSADKHLEGIIKLYKILHQTNNLPGSMKHLLAVTSQSCSDRVEQTFRNLDYLVDYARPI